MLYNQNWEKPTPEKLMELPTLINWLEKQPFYRTYCYQKANNCLLAKYFHENGYPDASVSPCFVWLTGFYFSGNVIAISEEVDYVLTRSLPFLGYRTFKGALKRARNMLALEQQLANAA